MSAEEEKENAAPPPPEAEAAAAAAAEEEEEGESPGGRPPRLDPSAAFCESVRLHIGSHHDSSHSNDSDARREALEEEDDMERTMMEQAQVEATRSLRQASMMEILRVGSRKTVSNERQLDDVMPSRLNLRGVSIAEEEEDEEEKEEEGKSGGGEKGGGNSKKKPSKIGVFNANSAEGCSIVRTLAKQGCDVVAIVRVTTSRNVRKMVRLPNVRVVVADSLHDREAIADAVRGCSQVFYVLKYWEKFDGALEETQTFTVFDSCYLADVSWVVFTTYEEVTELKRKGRKSQIVPRADGTVAMPSFAGLSKARDHADDRGIRVTHMITSYIDSKKRSLTLIKGGEKLIVVSNK